MLVVRVKLEETIDTAIDLADQSALDALAHHRALLAWNREQVGLDLGQQRPAESHVQLLLRPVGLGPDAIAQFEVLHAEIAGQVDRSTVQCAAACRVTGGGTAVDRKRQRHERIAEEQAAHPGQRQHAAELPAAFGNQVMRAMPEHFLQDFAPLDAVEERRIGTRGHEVRPRLAVAVAIRSHRGRRVRFDRKIEGLHAASISNTRSMRSQRKSERSRCSRDSVRSRFR